jgi:hypothetical protein
MVFDGLYGGQKWKTFNWAGAIDPPHLLPKYVRDKLLAREVVYQIVDKGVTTYMSEKNKRYWLISPIHEGQYSLLNKNQEEN